MFSLSGNLQGSLCKTVGMVSASMLTGPRPTFGLAKAFGVRTFCLTKVGWPGKSLMPTELLDDSAPVRCGLGSEDMMVGQKGQLVSCILCSTRTGN